MARPKSVGASPNISGDEKTQELQKKLEELQRQMAELLSGNGQTIQVEDDADNKIPQDDYVKVISLCPMQLNLSTQGMGKGKIFTFKTFGETKRILYSDLVDIMENHSNFLHEGFFYIMDSRVIRKHGLDDAYAKLLTKEQIQKIIVGDQKESVALFESANTRQRGFICEILIEKLKNDEKLDLNIIDRISRIAGINLSERANEAKAYQNMPA